MEKFVDVKYTQWTRFYFDEEADIDKIISKLEQTGDINEVLYKEPYKWDYSEELLDSCDYLTPGENDAATMELWIDEQLIWDNFNGREIS